MTPIPKPQPPKVRKSSPTPAAQVSPLLTRSRSGSGDGATYRSFLTAPSGQEVIAVIARELEDWLESKQRGSNDQIRLNTPPIALEIPDGASSWETRRREVQYLRGKIEGGNGLRLSMRETGKSDDGPTWTTRFTAFEPSDADVPGWVAIDITNDQDVFCRTPKIARSLVAALKLQDGSSQVFEGAHICFQDSQLAKVTASLTDEQRRYPIVMATTSGADLDVRDFTKQVDRWTRDLAGQAQVLVLTPELSALFNGALPEGLRVRPWTLRTFLPALDVANPSDWTRHRILSTQSLATRPDSQIRGIITNSARSAAHASTFPAQVDQVATQLLRRMRAESLFATREASRVALPASATAPLVAVQPQTTSILVSELQTQVLEALELTELTPEAIKHIHSVLARPAAEVDLLNEIIDEQDAELDEARSQLSATTNQLQFAEDYASELQSAVTDAEGENNNLRAVNAYLQGEVAKLNPQAAYSTPQPFQDVDDFFEIVDRLPELTHIVFTGDEDTVLQLSSGDRNGSEARNAWRALVSLNNYAQHHIDGKVRTFKDYVEGRGPADCQIRAGRCVPTESDSTVNQFGRTRIFPVPIEVNPSGRQMMLAHVRLGQSDTRAPRLHYFDAVDQTEKIFVGYIGPHLPNTRTSNA